MLSDSMACSVEADAACTDTWRDRACLKHGRRDRHNTDGPRTGLVPYRVGGHFPPVWQAGWEVA